jgi:hypothetical protein
MVISNRKDRRSLLYTKILDPRDLELALCNGFYHHNISRLSDCCALLLVSLPALPRQSPYIDSIVIMKFATTLQVLVVVVTTLSSSVVSGQNATDPPVDIVPISADNSTTPITSSGMCTLCDNGQVPFTDPTTVFFPNSKFNCSGLIADLATKGSDLGANDTECKDMQLLAFQIGCCQWPPYQYCTICEDGEPFVRGNEIPLGTADNPTCSAYEFRLSALNGVFEPGNCADTQLRRAGFYCGCPGTFMVNCCCVVLEHVGGSAVWECGMEHLCASANQ